MANEPDEVSTADEREVAALDEALGVTTGAEGVDTGTDAVEAPLEDSRPGDDSDDDPLPVLPNSMSPEEKRKRNQDHRANQKRVRKEKEEQAKREIEMLRSANENLNNRLATIEQRSVGSEVAAVDAAITKAGTDYNWYKGQIAEQQRANNPDGVAEATDKMFEAGRNFDRFTAIKNQVVQNQRRGAQPPPADPRLMAFGSKFMSDNPWYAPASGDEDSTIVLALDKALLNKGFNPSTEQYWTELNARIEKVLPHRAKRGYTPPNSGGRSPVGGGGGQGGSSVAKQGSFTLSAARVTAMKDAGVYDDPKKRAAMIEQYKKYDAQHAND